MTYLETSREIYNKIQSMDFRKLSIKFSKDFHRTSEILEEIFGITELRNIYVNDIQETINKYLPFFKNEFGKFLGFKEVVYYLRFIPIRTLSILFWIWEKKLNISEASMKNFIDLFFLGTFGYKMIDFSNDSKKNKPEYGLVGFYSIKLAENLLREVLGTQNSNEAINKYFAMYVETELLEKKNRWKECPFSWDDVEKLGNKAAPVFIVYESLFNYAKYYPKKNKEIIRSLTYSTAAIQLLDDLMDVKQDLTNGYETLVVKNYYKTYGIESEISDENINHILTQDRLKLIFNRGQELFNESTNILEKHDEYILQLMIEVQSINFNALFEFY